MTGVPSLSRLSLSCCIWFSFFLRLLTFFSASGAGVAVTADAAGLPTAIPAIPGAVRRIACRHPPVLSPSQTKPLFHPTAATIDFTGFTQSSFGARSLAPRGAGLPLPETGTTLSAIFSSPARLPESLPAPCSLACFFRLARRLAFFVDALLSPGTAPTPTGGDHRPFDKQLIPFLAACSTDPTTPNKG